MIDEAKLMALPYQTLVKAKLAIEKAMEARRYAVLVPGSTATFTDSRKGEVVRIRIIRNSAKSVSGERIDKFGTKIGGTWRVHPSMLVPDAVEAVRPYVAPVRAAAPTDRPMHESAGMF